MATSKDQKSQEAAEEAAAPRIAETPGDQQTVEQFRGLQEQEYGQYVAVEPIDHNGVRAYNVGDAVPASNVDRWEYAARGLVAKRRTKAGEEALRRAAEGLV